MTMSATNRGEERYDFDDYPTPNWCVHRMLDKMKPYLHGDFWIDPCAGSGSLIKAVNSHYAVPKLNWHANDIQAVNKEPLLRLASWANISDITHWLPDDELPKYDVWITNPPYNLAREVIEVGMQHAKTVAMLLRLNFLGSKARHPWISTHMPKYIGVLPDRPAFRVSKKTGKLGTDATEYAWMVWQAWDQPGTFDFRRKESETFMLGLTDPRVLEEDRERIRAGCTPRRTRSEPPPLPQDSSPTAASSLSDPPHEELA
jgi:hypothetical protein